MEEKKFLGMPKKVCLGLSWLVFPIGIVALAVDHEKMDRDDKKQFVSVFVAMGVFFIALTVFAIIQTILHLVDFYALDWLFTVLSLLLWVGLSLLPMIFAFLNDDFHCPIVFDLADRFVKENETNEASAPAEAVEENATEESPSEEPTEEKAE